MQASQIIKNKVTTVTVSSMVLGLLPPIASFISVFINHFLQRNGAVIEYHIQVQTCLIENQ